MPIKATHVHKILSRHMLAEGLDLVCDLKKSRGAWIYDAKRGRKFLDMYTCVSTLPLGYNHPGLTTQKFLKKLAQAAINKTSNPDLYTVELAEAVEALGRYAIPKYLPHLFIISGGALAVENALKAAFDWKVKKNFKKGVREERGRQVIHFRHAFHGRSGYTLSLTNTADSRKHAFFPKFDWPRIDPPVMRFPQNEVNRNAVIEAEATALGQIDLAIRERGDDIACLIIEPIQGEGGDNHFRPEFLRALRKVCDDHEILLIFDEVQTGFGMTGKMWAHQHWDIRPDLLAFGKKSQICGTLGGPRLDEIEKNVFNEKSRISSTFGGNLVDMVRMTRILEIMQKEKILESVRRVGRHLLKQLQRLEQEFSEVTNARGLGLLCAFDLPTTEMRDHIKGACFEGGMVILPSGTHSIRFRPPLNVTEDEIDLAVEILRKSIKKQRNR